ncbi:MAG: MBL fold metallo-hydrolase [Cyclobacteriaceae bacterium]|nr:MBL fold metallo-hydrolase [Cyclobacteriaceae bacterium]
MIATFLGTGTSQGVPVIGCTCSVCTSLDYRDKRLRTSLHLQTESNSLVIDTGPDFRQQMLREKIKSIQALLFTHAHRDHTAGLDDIRAYNFMQQQDIPLYAQIEVINQLKKEYSYIFSEHKYPGIPQLNCIEINETQFTIGADAITPLPVMHYKLPVLGFRIKNFAYITDANFIGEETFKKLEGIETLVLNALQIEIHISHFNLEEAIEIVEKVKPRRTYFTHISHKLGTHNAISKLLPSGIELAYDGLKIEV